MVVAVAKQAHVLIDYWSIEVGPFLLPLYEECLVDRTEHLLRVPLVDLKGLPESADLVTVILLSCPLILVVELSLCLSHQVICLTSVIFIEIVMHLIIRRS